METKENLKEGKLTDMAKSRTRQKMTHVVHLKGETNAYPIKNRRYTKVFQC